MFIYLRTVNEEKAGKRWKSAFEKAWPYYKAWFVSEGYKARPGYLSSSEALKEYMPELAKTYKRLCKLAGGGDLEARFLSQYSPPAFMSGCSQIAWTKDATRLIRNYDYSPRLFEGIFTKTNWLKPVIGMSDCMWGLLDGMNADGLSASLTFGGRNTAQTGFGIPLVMRYVLETCSTVEEAIEAFGRVPVHMSYNVTLLDKSKRNVTLYLSPDRPMDVMNTPIGTNHQHRVEWDDYAAISATIARQEFLEQCLENPAETIWTVQSKFLQDPLYTRDYAKKFGTLYTAIYDVENLTVQLLWPNKERTYSFEHFPEEKMQIRLDNLNINSKLAF